jgi:hypothetical protein
MKAIYKKLTASASALTMLAASMAVGGVTASARGGSDSGTDSTNVSDYTISIPSTLDVTQAGWNELTGGISAKGSLGQYEKLVVSATSANDWALVSGENRVGYNLAKSAADYDPNAETPSWEFGELNADGVSQPAGINVENFDDKPAGEYTDTVTFKAEIVDTTVHLNGINIINETMNLVTEDLLSYGGTSVGWLKVEFAPENTTDDKTVTWESSDPSIATVNKDGCITAVGTGDAVIKATVGEFSDTCVVSVNKVTIDNETYHTTDEHFKDFTTKDGLINVKFGNPRGIGYYNFGNDDGWYAEGANSYIDISSNVEGIEIVKTRFSSKSGSTEITEAPFKVYSFENTFHTGENGEGTHIGNEGGINKIEVYVKTTPKYADQLSSGYYVSQEIIDTYWWPSNILDRAGMTNSAFGKWKAQTISEDEAIALAKYLGKDSMVFYSQGEEEYEYYGHEEFQTYWGAAKNDGNSVESVKLYNNNLHDDPTPMKGYTIYYVVPE